MATCQFLSDYFPQADAHELSELRKRLKEMKDLLGEEELDMTKLSSPKKSSFLDGNMVSLVFAVAMGLILSVTVYAFQHLYTAVMKRFQPL
jgi:hypothetical protein